MPETPDPIPELPGNVDPNEREEVGYAIREAIGLRELCPYRFDALTEAIAEYRQREVELMRDRLFKTTTVIALD